MILILLMSSLTIITGRSVSMCRNDTHTSTNYQLSRLQSDPITCTCLFKSTELNITKVSFNMIAISGCRFKLGFYLKKNLLLMAFDSTASIFQHITSETIKLNLELYREGESGTTLYMNITSTPDLTVSCFVPRIETSSTQLHTTIIPSTEPSTIIISTKPRTIITSIPIVTSQHQTIRITTSSDEETVAGDTSLTSTTSPPLITVQSEEKSSCDDRTAGIAVGCFIGGIVFGIIAVLGLQWIRMKRQKKDEMYSTPTNINRDVHAYASIIPGTGVGNINTTRGTTETSDAMVEATLPTNSTGENSTNNPSVTYQNVSNNPYLNIS